MAKTLNDYRSHPLFEVIRHKIICAGIPDTFFDPDARGGYDDQTSYVIQQNSHEFAAFLCWLWNRRAQSAGLQYAEIGSASFGFMRMIREVAGIQRAYSVDIGEQSNNKKEENLQAMARAGLQVKRYYGSSHSLAALEFLKVPLDLLFIDGDHSYEGVKMDIELALSVKPKFIGFHDIVCPQVPGVGQAYQEAVKAGKLTPLAEFISESHPFGISVCEIGQKSPPVYLNGSEPTLE